MNTTALFLSREIITWWKDAQYWCHGDYNVFDEEPTFVVRAKEVLEEEGFQVTSDGDLIKAPR